MATLMERIGNERKRLRLVRQRMVAGLEAKANGDEAYVPFYVAVGDYIDTTMQRLHDQDVKMGKMIVEKVDEVDDAVEKALGELEERLKGANAHLKPFLEARDPTQPVLRPFEDEKLEQQPVVVDRHAPLLVMVINVLVTLSPRAAAQFDNRLAFFGHEVEVVTFCTIPSGSCCPFTQRTPPTRSRSS